MSAENDVELARSERVFFKRLARRTENPALRRWYSYCAAMCTLAVLAAIAAS